jgi:DNA-binding NtrC family response regulator
LETEQPAALLLLDVDELRPEAQAVLADVLNIAEFNVQALSTSRANLFQLAEEGRFRHDLACSLATLIIELPPLAERSEDVPCLAQLFLEEMNAAGGRQLSGFTPEALDELMAYPWPGNVDEMSELIAESCRVADGAMVDSADLPAQIRWKTQAARHSRRPEETIVLDDFLAEIEVELIRRALQRAEGNKAKAARLLGVTRARLLRRASRWDLG